jgi:hypothetical protein
MTTTSTAIVATTRAARYGKQLVSHLGRRSVGIWDAATETGSLDMNDNTVHVAFSTSPDALHIEIRSAEGDIATYEDVVGRHLARFGERDELHARWVRADGTDGTTQG